MVVATGVFQHDHPVVPDFATGLDSGIRQLHSADYRSPAQLQPGPVLVVGASHSGGDIALEVALAGHRTILSGPDTGQIPHKVIMSRVLGPLVKLVATRVLTVSTPMGRKAKKEIRSHGGPLLRVRRSDLAAAGVERVFERTVGVEDGKPVLADGRVVEVTNVIWCTGFRNDYTWIRFPVPLEDGWYPVQVGGAVPSSPGLYFVGLPFLHSFSSMLVLGASRDAARAVAHLVSRAPEGKQAAVLDGAALVA